MAAAETLQARRAALLLHGLTPVQRRLVMAKLGAVETSRLEPMLDELARIGIPREARLGTDALAKEPIPRELTAVQRAAQLDATSVLRALETCGPGTIGHLLRAHKWPWKADVFERLPEPRRTRALDSLQARLPPLAPAALTFLCTRLCAEAERAAALPQIDAGPRSNRPTRWGCDPFKRWVPWGR